MVQLLMAIYYVIKAGSYCQIPSQQWADPLQPWAEARFPYKILLMQPAQLRMSYSYQRLFARWQDRMERAVRYHSNVDIPKYSSKCNSSLALAS